MKIITRSEAKAAGLKRYFTGKPCLRGHISEAQTSSGTCLECDAEKNATKERLAPMKSGRPHGITARRTKTAKADTTKQATRSLRRQELRRSKSGMRPTLKQKRPMTESTGQSAGHTKTRLKQCDVRPD